MLLWISRNRRGGGGGIATTIECLPSDALNSDLLNEKRARSITRSVLPGRLHSYL